MVNEYEILGQQVIGEMQQAEMRSVVGAAMADGFDFSSAIQAAAELSQKGVQAYQASQASDQAKKDQAGALARATTADASWASAEQMLDLARTSHDPARIAAAQALQASAQQGALAAGAGLISDTVAKRVAAAQDAAKKAAQDSLNNPNDAAKAALMRAWQKVAASAGIVPSGSSGGLTLSDAHGGRGGGGGPSFFTKHYAGIPGWGWLVGGAVTVTGIGLLIRAMRK